MTLLLLHKLAFVFSIENKKFELMLRRSAKAYSSSGSVLAEN